MRLEPSHPLSLLAQSLHFCPMTRFAIMDGPFRWRDQLVALLRMGPFPLRWTLASALVLLSSIAAILFSIWAGIHFYDDPDELFGEKRFATYWSTGLLAGCGVVCFLTRGNAPQTLRGFWLFSGLLLCLTAADELGHIHEQLDHLIHTLLGWDPNDPTTDHLDDVMVLSYVIPAGWLWWTHRRDLIRMRLMVQTLLIGGLFFSAMVATDMIGVRQWKEESLKILAGAFILCGFLGAYFEPGDGEQGSSGVPAVPGELR